MNSISRDEKKEVRLFASLIGYQNAFNSYSRVSLICNIKNAINFLFFHSHL